MPLHLCISLFDRITGSPRPHRSDKTRTGEPRRLEEARTGEASSQRTNCLVEAFASPLCPARPFPCLQSFLFLNLLSVNINFFFFFSLSLFVPLVSYLLNIPLVVFPFLLGLTMPSVIWWLSFWSVSDAFLLFSFFFFPCRRAQRLASFTKGLATWRWPLRFRMNPMWVFEGY